MKYSFTSFSCPQLSLNELFDLAQTCGYDGVELRVGRGHGHGVELATSEREREVIRQQHLASDIAICCLGASCTYVNPAETEMQLRETHRHIDLAAAVGVPLVRVFCGELIAGISRERSANAIVSALQTAAPYAHKQGITLIIETHDDWSDPKVVASLLERINHPAVGVLWDYMHTVRHAFATVDEAFESLRPWLRHVHFHDSTLRREALEFRPLGEGALDTPRVVELLLQDGFQGYLSGEWIGWERPYERHLPEELLAVKAYEESLTW